MNDSTATMTKEDIINQTARRYLADKMFAYLVGKAQRSKLGQVLKNAGVEGINLRLVRDVMQESDRFECVDRRWTIGARFGESGRPFERVVSNLLTSAGTALSQEVMASELAQILGRSAEHYTEVLPKFLTNKENFFLAAGSKYGLANWLLNSSADDEVDVIFDSFLFEEQVEKYSQACPAKDWNADAPVDTAVAVINDYKEAIPFKILSLFAWRSIGGDFDPVEFYSQITADERLIMLSDHKVYSTKAENAFKAALIKIADQLAELPMEAEEEEADEPVVVTPSDKEEIVSLIISKGSASAEELLLAVLEVSPSESVYAGALDSLVEALADEDRIMWVGGTRWAKKVEFPEEINSIPESLILTEIPAFETPEGDVFDQMIEDDGFEGDLKSAIYEPLAEDVTDEDPNRTIYQANGESQRCVLKYHHKLEGTFPLCQIAPDFFGVTPEIIPIVLINEGKRKNVFVNNNTRLMYGMKDFYKDIHEVSGAVFHIEKTAIPGEYRFRYDNESDEQLGIDTNRSLELLDIKARFESQDMPLYDVITEILGKKQGMTFAHLVTEVNIIKRCSRLLVASILSSYHAFNTKGKNGLWQLDEKKQSQGFNKSKRKYIKK